MNHPTVVFKKSIIKAVEGYPNFRTNQDQALWALLLNRGYRLHNLDDVLVLMRVDKKFMERRLKNRFINEHKMLKFQKKIGFIDQKIFLLMIILRWLTRLFPKKLFNLMYRVVRIFLNWHNTHKP
jgi:amylovoran biosynthesis glycosyltransferase AmsE